MIDGWHKWLQFSLLQLQRVYVSVVIFQNSLFIISQFLRCGRFFLNLFEDRLFVIIILDVDVAIIQTNRIKVEFYERKYNSDSFNVTLIGKQ